MLRFAFVLALLLQTVPVPRPTIVAERSGPPHRNFYLIQYDDKFLFAARHYGNVNEPGAITEPGLFVHSKEHSALIRITKISTAGGSFGSSNSDDPEVQKRLRFASVSWDFSRYAAEPYVPQPMRTSGSIVFPEKITYDSGAAISIFVWLIVLGWTVSTILTIYGLARQASLPPTYESDLIKPHAPYVSVVVPARNEEHRVLSESILSMLSQDYGRFEIIAVDDRSTDGTLQVLEALKKDDPRLRVIQGKELEPGWLGKPYAMQQGLTVADGDWILATDADMIFAPSTLRTAMSHALSQNVDAISLIPHFEAVSFWERVMIPTWAWVFLMFSLFYRTNDPKSPGAVGIGGFFLVKRQVLDRLRCFDALKDEVMEDVRLAEMIKRSGGRLTTISAPGLVRTRMYTNFREMWECSTKNWFSGVKFSVPFAIYCIVSMYSMAVVPPVLLLVAALGSAIGWSEIRFLVLPAALAWLLQVVNLILVSVHSKVSPLYSLTAPLGLGLLYAMLFDSCVRVSIGKGVTWKGRRIYERDGIKPPSHPPIIFDSATDEHG